VIKNINKYVKGCDLCQRMKNRMETPVEKLMINKIPERLSTYLMVDLITKLPFVVKKNVILVVYDGLLKITHFMTTTEGILVEGLV